LHRLAFAERADRGERAAHRGHDRERHTDRDVARCLRASGFDLVDGAGILCEVVVVLLVDGDVTLMERDVRA
jgi:hypothetical protein